MQADAMERLMNSRSEDGMWRGKLSSSAISTSVSVYALQRIDAEKYAQQIENGVRWLNATMKPDGSWGDTVESPSNMTATLLTYVSLYAVGKASDRTRAYLNQQFGGETEEALIKGVLNYYGKDYTFSVPILMMCALAGVISNWKKIPPFPFELATLPQKLFRYLNLPVVSYAIPALIAIGICQMRKSGKKKMERQFSISNCLRPVRNLFVPKAMRVLRKMQPEDGGYLEAAPLTAFVSMCLAESGFREHEVTQQCAKFLVDTVREDGAWSIDTNLSGWVTSLAAKVIKLTINNEQLTINMPFALTSTPSTLNSPPTQGDSGGLLTSNPSTLNSKLSEIIKRNATKDVHPFTGARHGGWGWSDLSGSVPDGDDTSGALIALHHLTHGTVSKEIEEGLKWLMWLQNNDGGMPTFCKGWGKLPFDRSTPDITAHAMLAMGLWIPSLNGQIKRDVQRSYNRMLRWMQGTANDAGWTPLWFGDQDATDEKAPVYGTATVIDYLMQSNQPEGKALAESKVQFLINCQNEDGGWGGNKGVCSKVTFTSRALAALAHFPDRYEENKQKGWEYLYERYKAGTLYVPEPIGLYFSRLWYSEDLYNVTFLLHAIKCELNEE